MSPPDTKTSDQPQISTLGGTPKDTSPVAGPQTFPPASSVSQSMQALNVGSPFPSGLLLHPGNNAQTTTPQVPGTTSFYHHLGYNSSPQSSASHLGHLPSSLYSLSRGVPELSTSDFDTTSLYPSAVKLEREPGSQSIDCVTGTQLKANS